MTRPWRIGIAVAFFALITGLCFWGVFTWVRRQPPNVNFAAHHDAGRPVHLTVQTVGTMGTGHPHPAWVSYLVKAPDGKWVHSTQWELPAYTRIDVTVLEYDGGHALRNQVWAKVQGTIGGVMTLNGKTVRQVSPQTAYGETHTFTVPALGLNVPFAGVNGNSPTFCTTAPCTPSHVHNVIKFSFMTRAPGQYHWQCMFPCAAGYLDGNGGPMQTLGYMDGFLKVMPSPGHPLQVGQ